MLEVVYHHAKFGGARISPAAVTATNVEVFLYICLSVTFSWLHLLLRSSQVALVLGYHLFLLIIVVRNCT